MLNMSIVCRSLATLLVIGLGATGCASGDPQGFLLGGEFLEPLEMPAGVLTDQHGQSFDLREDTNGGLTLLFFGFTSCPDVCPNHMAAISRALDSLDARQRDRIQVLFVTVDPARDSLPRLAEWLLNFDSSFVGLTGPDSTVGRVQEQLGLVPGGRPTKPLVIRASHQAMKE